MLPTPDISHLTSSDYEKIYEPCEDSFVFLDGLEQDQNLLRDLNPSLCLEIGPGSGIVSTFLGRMLGPSCVYLAAEINPSAAEATIKTGLRNKVTIDVIQTDLCAGIVSRLASSVDILLFNPPYVVTGQDELGSQDITAAWAGGINGRQVIDRFLPLVKDLLSPLGVFYLITINENRPEEICAWMREMGLESERVLYRKAGNEGLSLLRFWHSNTSSR